MIKGEIIKTTAGFFLLAFFSCCALATTTDTDQQSDRRLLDEIQIISQGDIYEIHALGKTNDSDSIFADDVVISIFPSNQAYKTAVIAVGESDLPQGVTLEKAHILPGKDQQFVIDINSGGNDIIASCGGRFYTLDAGQPRLLLNLEWGDPQAKDVDGDGVEEIVTSAEYWGEFLSHVDCIPYLDTIYAYDGSRITKQTDKYRKSIPFDKSFVNQFEDVARRIKVQHRSYEDLTEDDRLDVFRSTVGILLAYRDCGKRSQAQNWWEKKVKFISQMMDTEHYGEVLLELEPGKGRMWNGADYPTVK